jgi:hypothetical protein
MPYSEKELRDEMYRVSEEHCDGQAPKHHEMDEYGDIKGGAYTYRFDTWNNALKKFGFEINQEKYSDEEVLKEIRRVSEKFFDSQSYSKRDFHEFSDMAKPTPRNHFGTWNQALEEAGLQPVVEKNIETRRLVNEIQRVSKEYCDNERPRTDDMIEHAKFAFDCYHRRSWERLLKEAGFEPFEHPTGEDHWCWKGGVEYDYTHTWYSARANVRERDENICQVCMTEEFKNNYPDVHHITPVRYWDIDEEHEKMNHPRNLICLCRDCHAKLEGKFKGRSYEEFKRLAKDYLGMEEQEERSVFDY